MFTPGAQVRWWLLWAAVPYGLIARLRARLYARGWLSQRKLPVPVISIGNLTLGGTGKTPVVIHLAEWLIAEGKRVAILSRGYRRAGHDSMLLVSDGVELLAGAQEAGDEPYLMARRCPKAVVAVGADRYELGRWLLNRFSLDCFLLDDGFQHLGLGRDVNLLLIDATDAQGLAAVVPAGRLREPIGAAARATAIVVTRADVPAQVAQVVQRLRKAIGQFIDPIQVVFRAEGLLSVTTKDVQSREWCQGKAALICSGIGHASSFRALAETLGFRILDEVVYPDHYAYSATDVARLRAKATALKADVVVTTEKDAGKLAALLTADDRRWWAVRLGTVVTAGEDRFRRLALEPARRASEEVYA